MIPRPEPRGYAGNLGLPFAEHAASARPAIVDLHDARAPREVSYAELDALCNAVARGLRQAGLEPGDRIAIVSLNRHEFIATLLGAMRAGVALASGWPECGSVAGCTKAPTRAPELWHQKSYLARVILMDGRRGIVDEGILPLQSFVDGQGPDGVAIAVEANPQGEIYPAVYVRRANAVGEHLLPTNALLDFETAEHRSQLATALAPLL